MNRITLFNLFLLLLMQNAAHAQIDQGFIKHLSEDELTREHQQYLKTLPDVSDDSISLYKSKYYLQYWSYNDFKKYYDSSLDLALKDSCLMTLASIRLIDSHDELRRNWFSGPEISSLSYRGLKQASIVSDDPRFPFNPPELLYDSYSDHLKYSRKKPLVAAGLSAAVPGLGKYYAGRRNSAVIVFFSHLVYSFQSYEAVRKTGWGSAFTIASLSYFSINYFANVYGSYTAVKKVKAERKKQFLKDAAEYYSRTCNCTLY